MLVQPLEAQQREDREPEAATGRQSKNAFNAKKYMVVAANPYASWAGKNILEKGGSAIDAAIAVQAMLTLVEPQSSGIGGGAFILYWDNKGKKLHTFDGRETAPKASRTSMFMQTPDKPMSWIDAVVGGKSVGVPGVLKALELAHQDFGKLPWLQLFNDAINTSEGGFRVSDRLATLLALKIHPGLYQFRDSSVYFYPDGKPLVKGQLRKNSALARTLLHIAETGADGFYQGELAKSMAKAAQFTTINPGEITEEDFAQYQALKRSPVCGAYKDFKVCGMGPPSSGGINVLQILRMLEPFNLSQYAPNSLEAMHLFTQASKLAFADREMYIADTDFTGLPISGLISQSYLSSRARHIDLNKDMGRARPGQPYAMLKVGQDNAYELPNTSHISIVDSEGNALSMTTSIEFAFGSGVFVEGFLLNNQMTDFSLNPSSMGKPVLNRVEPLKRPRSAMSPTMVFDKEGQLFLALGSPGGSRIINYVAQTLIGVLDWGLDIQQAINLPHVTDRNDYTALEKGTMAEELAEGLKAKGHQVKIIDLNSGLHGIQIKDNTLMGGADPRREGVAVGM
ncbi:gamma-glutamyltransferase [Flavobacterium sp. W21_SRS_FM6]|uniref:gamma-glutamyltransferase n=1 Tax=Flavobacterium sp. W21_SRS_FM6 TaxID=3240268 RepID=UPI003F8F59F0